MHEYLKILIKHVEENDMVNSIIINDKRIIVLDTLKSIRKDLSFSINGMNEKANIAKIKDKYKNSK